MNSWSELPPELLHLIVDGSIVIQVVASAVCRSWHFYLQTKPTIYEMVKDPNLHLYPKYRKIIRTRRKNHYNLSARLGNLENLKWLIETSISHSYNQCQLLVNAATSGNLEMMAWLWGFREMDESTYLSCWDVFEAAASRGNLEVMKWLIDNNCSWTQWTLYEAFRHGKIENVQWLIENGLYSRNMDKELFRNAVKSGNLELLKWLRDPNGFGKATKTEEVCSWSERTFIAAARRGNLEVMKWLRSEGCPWDEHTFYAVASRRSATPNVDRGFAKTAGNLEIMKWLHSEGCPMKSYLFYIVTSRRSGLPNVDRGFGKTAGNLENMKWLHSVGCPWSDITFNAAAKRGNLEILDWLKANDCPWDNNIPSEVSKCCRSKVLKWLKANGYC